MNDVPVLGRLEQADLREAWIHEAQMFTPWLAAHLDRLSEVIGIQLERVGEEVAVERFAADILARNPLDDSLVLIENQLGTTDHNHLGQIMTYLAGLNAHTVIWIAAEFREPHLSAIKWLNEHTADPFAFFAVRVKVVRIGDSPLAPVFEVLGRPNRWERQLQADAQEAGPMKVWVDRRHQFWTHYLERHPDEKRHGNRLALPSRWRTLDDLGLVISTYVARDQVGIFVRGLRSQPPEEVYEILKPRRRALERRLGARIWPDGEYFLWQSHEGDVGDPAQRDELADWLYEMANKYEAALREVFGGTG